MAGVQGSVSREFPASTAAACLDRNCSCLEGCHRVVLDVSLVQNGIDLGIRSKDHWPGAQMKSIVRTWLIGDEEILGYAGGDFSRLDAE